MTPPPTSAFSAFSAFAPEPFPTLQLGDDLAGTITQVLYQTGTPLQDRDIVVVASKAVSIAEKRYVDLASVTPSAEAERLAARTGKPPAIVQLILDHSTEHFLATDCGPIIARLLPVDPDASARALRDALITYTGADVAVVIADSDGRADRRGATCISIGAAGVVPLRITEHDGKRQEETLTDMITGAAGIILGQRGRGAPVVVLRGIAYEPFSELEDDSSGGVRSILHHTPSPPTVDPQTGG